MKNKLNNQEKKEKINKKKLLVSSLIIGMTLSTMYNNLEFINNQLDNNNKVDYSIVIPKGEQIKVESTLQKLQNQFGKNELFANESILLNNNFDGFHKVLSSKIKEKHGIKYFENKNGIHVIMEKFKGKYLDKSDFNNSNEKIFYYNNYVDFYYKSMNFDVDNIDFISYILKNMKVVSEKTPSGIKIIKLNFKNYGDLEKEYYGNAIKELLQNSNGYIIK